MLSNFPEKAHQSYRTFQKKFVEVRGLFGKYMGVKPHLPTSNHSGAFAGLSKKMSAKLPDISEKVHQGQRTFQKLSGKVTGLFENSSPRSSNFSKIVRQRYQNFRKSRKIPVNILSGQRGKRDTRPILFAFREGYCSTLIRAQSGLRLPLFRSKRSPYRAPFQNKPK